MLARLSPIVLVLAAIALQAQTPAPPKDDKLDLTIKGELRPDDPKDRITKQPSKVHTVKLRGGQAYLITLDAADKKLDPLVRVEDANGNELARDDDSGGNLNAKLLFLAPKDDEYRVIATAYDGAGTYVLRVRASDGKVYDVGKEGLVIEGKLAMTDPPLAFLKGAPHQVFHVKLQKGQCYVLDLFSKEFDSFLIVEDARGTRLAHDNDSGAGLLDARLVFKAPADGVYRVLAAALDQKPDDFVVRIRAGELTGDDGVAAQVLALSREGVRFLREEKLADALARFEQALRICYKLYPAARFDDGHRDLALSLNNLAGVLHSLGRSSEAVPYCERALTMREKLYRAVRFPNGHAGLSRSLNDLGVVLHSLSQPGKALAYHARALAMDEQLYPARRFSDGHPDLATSLNNVGFVLNELGQSMKALAYLERALAMREKLYPATPFPNGHVDLAASLNNMGFVLNALGQRSKALAYFQRAFAMQEKLYPPIRFPKGHPHLAGSLNNVGSAFKFLGQPSQALPYYERALAMWEKLFPDGHPDAASGLDNLGRVFESLDLKQANAPLLEIAGKRPGRWRESPSAVLRLLVLLGLSLPCSPSVLVC